MAHGQSLSPLRCAVSGPSLLLLCMPPRQECDQGAISGEPAGFDSRIAHLWIAHLVEQSTNTRSVAGSTPAPKLSAKDSLCNACSTRRLRNTQVPATGPDWPLYRACGKASGWQPLPPLWRLGIRERAATASLEPPRRCRAKCPPGRRKPAPYIKESEYVEAICDQEK